MGKLAIHMPHEPQSSLHKPSYALREDGVVTAWVCSDAHILRIRVFLPYPPLVATTAPLGVSFAILILPKESCHLGLCSFLVPSPPVNVSGAGLSAKLLRVPI